MRKIRARDSAQAGTVEYSQSIPQRIYDKQKKFYIVLLVCYIPIIVLRIILTIILGFDAASGLALSGLIVGFVVCPLMLSQLKNMTFVVTDKGIGFSINGRFPYFIDYEETDGYRYEQRKGKNGYLYVVPCLKAEKSRRTARLQFQSFEQTAELEEALSKHLSRIE
ncbi:MAG: hypothetical protein LBT20_06345 [Clostridiales bacterium]|jgi:hypothetical protein|nr:hypothetical protein [Clostridiales bacterium]